MADEITTLIGDLGFPIAVAAFVLFRMNGKLERLTKAIEKLIERMDRHAERKEE